MMNKIYFILLLLLGFLMMPSTTYACGLASKGHSCKMEIATKSKKHDCCKKQSKSSNKGCTGKCGQAMCSVSSLGSGISVSVQYDLYRPLFNIVKIKQNFSQVLSVPSDGYITLWVIPKIG